MADPTTPPILPPFWDRALELIQRFLGVSLAVLALAGGAYYVLRFVLPPVPMSWRLAAAAGALMLGLAGAAYWSRREDALDTPRLHGLCQTVVRYYLAYIFVTYGLAKLYRTQLSEPLLLWQDTPVGELSGFALTWTFFGTSFAYTTFIAVSQLLCAALLLFRRTQLLGAFALLPIIGNIVFVNFAYDIPVKFFSCLFLVMTAYLVLSDVRRLKAFFWDHRATLPSPRRQPVLQKPGVRRVLKIATVLTICGFCLWRLETLTAEHGRIERPVYGIWDVSDVEPASGGAAAGWKRLIFEANSGGELASVKTETHRRLATYHVDSTKQTLTLDLRNGPTFEGRYRRATDERLQLRGRLGTDSLTIYLRRRD